MMNLLLALQKDSFHLSLIKLMRSCNTARLQQSQWNSCPILPFLAPRAFAPWPDHLRQSRSHYRQASSQQCSKLWETLPVARNALLQTCIHERPADDRARTWPKRPITVKRHFYSAIALEDGADDAPRRHGRDPDKAYNFDPSSAGRNNCEVGTTDQASQASSPSSIFEDEDDQVASKVSNSWVNQEEQQIAQQWYKEMVQSDAEDTLYRSWDALTSEMKSYRWPLMVSWLSQQKSVDTAWNFIARTVSGIEIPAEELQQILLQATVDITQVTGKARLRQIAYNVYLALQFIPDQDDRLLVPTLTIRFLASYSKGSSVRPVYEFLRARKAEIRPSTTLRFASRFAQLQDPLALELLEGVTFSPRILRSQSILDICGLIMENSADSRSATNTDNKILARIMKLKVPMKTRLANALIHNALTHGSVETAMRLYSRLKEGGQLQPDGRTYLLLLPHLQKPATLGWFLEIQRDIRREGIQNMEPDVAHELMHARYQHTKYHHFDLMLGLYEVQFSLFPLKQLGIVREDYEARRHDYFGRFCGPLPLPKRNIVELMLHIFTYSKPRRVLPIVEVYRNLVRLRNAGDPLFLLLARRLTSWAIILKNLCSYEGTLRAWPQVLRDMESPALDSHGKPYAHPWTGKPWLPPIASSSRLWNIIVNGYAKKGFMAEAERVLELMSQRRVQPDLHTFTPLLKGYASLQDIRGIERTLRKVEVAGGKFEMNGHMRRAFEPFKDKVQLARALDDSARRRLDPYAARAADELFESEETPAPLGSRDEFERWDMFANAAENDAQKYVNLDMEEADQGDIVQQSEAAQPVTPSSFNAGFTVNINSLEDQQADEIFATARSAGDHTRDFCRSDDFTEEETELSRAGRDDPNIADFDKQFRLSSDAVEVFKQTKPNEDGSGWAMLASEDWARTLKEDTERSKRQEPTTRFRKRPTTSAVERKSKPRSARKPVQNPEAGFSTPPG